jgi:hypothetical protein
MSLLVLVLRVGMAIVQLSSLGRVEASDTGALEHGQLIGLMAVFASCFTSGFAGA